ncbi:hypothetical protein [Candidatus Palauibacter sp.]|uniref:hypothetical protein n=1 Tax=Candidatus Palauibacter sp. TaxID=3101350 RepID=UPI003B58DF63
MDSGNTVRDGLKQFVRRLIREKRETAERRPRPSEVFERYFGPEHGVELPARARGGYRPVSFGDESET